ncbi:MAG: nucleoside phosphorylase [Bacteroidia bacterium]|nr:nucleoside phosphorylase [Bacteroidia bacterium]
MHQIPESELILNPDGSIYHLSLFPEDIADTIINVGDPDRVKMVSDFFDKVEIRKQKREFVTHTGSYSGKRITVISTGIGTDNIDIVYNELDALVNIDLKSRTIKNDLKSLNLIRIGTSGALQEEILPDSFVCSSYGLGLDGLLNYYHWNPDKEETELQHLLMNELPSEDRFPAVYIAKASQTLQAKLSEGMHTGITASCSGFYGPQEREIRLKPFRNNLIDRLSAFRFKDLRITNFEMETGAMYGLARMLGHQCCSVNVIVANRIRQEFSKKPYESVKELIELTLSRI